MPAPNARKHSRVNLMPAVRDGKPSAHQWLIGISLPMCSLKDRWPQRLLPYTTQPASQRVQAGAHIVTRALNPAVADMNYTLPVRGHTLVDLKHLHTSRPRNLFFASARSMIQGV
jgi:hypothetical protein